MEDETCYNYKYKELSFVFGACPILGYILAACSWKSQNQNLSLFKMCFLTWNQFRRKEKTNQWLHETGAPVTKIIFTKRRRKGNWVVLSRKERSVTKILRNQYPHIEDGVENSLAMLNTHTFEKLIPFLGISLTYS